MRDGRCLKTVSPQKSKSRSPSPPFIKWKPLRKPIDKAFEEEEEGSQARKGKEQNRAVIYRTPSPPKPVPPPSVKARPLNLPKYISKIQDARQVVG